MSALATAEAALGLAVAGAPKNSVPGVYNNSRANLLKFANAKARVRAGTGRGKVAWVGPSTIAGTGAGTGVNYRDGMRKKALPALVGRILTDRGLYCFDGAFFGTQHYFTEVAAIDPRIAVGANWVQSTVPVMSLGGEMFRHNVATGVSPGAADAITFTPDINYNAAALYAPSFTNFRNLEVLVNSVSIETVLGDTTPQGVRVRNYTSGNAAALATPGKYPIALRKAASVSSGSTYVLGLETWDTTTPGISMANMGWGGSDSADWTDTTYPFSPMAALAVYAPDLTVLEFGPNDQQRPTTISAFTTALQAMVTAAKLSGDCMLIMAPADGLTPPQGAPTEAQYRDAMKAIALANNCVFVDFLEIWPSYADANTLGWFRDTVHPNDVGYWAQATVPADILWSC